MKYKHFLILLLLSGAAVFLVSTLSSPPMPFPLFALFIIGYGSDICFRYLSRMTMQIGFGPIVPYDDQDEDKKGQRILYLLAGIVLLIIGLTLLVKAWSTT
ncbi:MAG: hypothetical protein DHS20C11_14190 [Lysobacteraceae bacterium]|nr:MAG: hypothetical protein DHS20C11_14190 [Xanthomonadaceae bacterium]